MAVVQSTFTEENPLGYAGLEADGELSNIISANLEGDTAVAFGRPVYQGTDDRGAVLTVSANLRGFTLARKGMPVTEDRPEDTYAPGDTFPIKERGKIWINSISTATKGQQVYVTSGGEITNSSGGNTAATGWVYDDTITVAGLARIVRR